MRIEINVFNSDRCHSLLAYFTTIALLNLIDLTGLGEISTGGNLTDLSHHTVLCNNLQSPLAFKFTQFRALKGYEGLDLWNLNSWLRMRIYSQSRLPT